MMRLHYVEVCGFRGFRDKVRVDFGTGFTVLSGRNGVGKSTLCDAIEFAILGELTKYTVESSAKETVRDYLWWRGDGTPEAHYVTLAFVSSEGHDFVIHRSRESGADKTPEEITRALCKGAIPDDPLRQLCKTSVIRDEWIASLSLDLTETQRFDLVRAALGSVEGSDLAARAKDILGLAEASVGRATAAYQDARSQLSTELVQLSDAQDVAGRSNDITDALAELAAVVTPELGDLSRRLDIARRSLPDRRRRVEGLQVAAFEERELTLHREAFNAPEALRLRETVGHDLQVARSNLDRVERDLELATAAFTIEARANDIAASLAILVEHGERLGLHDDTCPLCSAHRTSDQFSEGLAAARRRIAALAGNVAEAGLALDRARSAADEPKKQVAELEQLWAKIDEEAKALRSRELAYLQALETYGLDSSIATNEMSLDRQAAAEREGLLRLELALNSLEASKAVANLASVESRVLEVRRRADVAGDDLSRAQGALAYAKALEKGVRRASSEIVDERLARISPLLNELYQRLRPHANWRTIDYSIRGDVRRFLSLKVGDDLNPQFVFSSGQRRAAGLAFLLSVHLARPWAQWDTLVLDDPVQHIDDFRALHLVEVLSALRQSGKQVVVAVEDEALADLLCRRLVSTERQMGKRVTIDVGEAGSNEVVSEVDIAPMELNVFRKMDSVQAVG